MEPPSLEEMVGATIEPMIETTGNQVDMDEFLNPPEPETELRHRTNVQSVSSGKIKLSLTYEKVCKSSQLFFFVELAVKEEISISRKKIFYSFYRNLDLYKSMYMKLKDYPEVIYLIHQIHM